MPHLHWSDFFHFARRWFIFTYFISFFYIPDHSIYFTSTAPRDAIKTLLNVRVLNPYLEYRVIHRWRVWILENVRGAGVQESSSWGIYFYSGIIWDGIGAIFFERGFGMSGVHLKGKCLECGRLFDKVFTSVCYTGCGLFYSKFAFLIGDRGGWDDLRINLRFGCWIASVCEMH